jgi:Ca2+-transporting ATPase
VARDRNVNKLLNPPSASIAHPWVGLSQTEAAHRLAVEGPNELTVERGHSLLGLVRGVLAEPMFLLLLGAVGIYLLLGDPIEALVLACSLLAVIAITVYQERRTERALEALRDLSSPRALVIREGQQQRIPGQDVVRGDLVVVREGDRIPADAILRESVGISIDESLLTGESVPVSKRAEDGEPAPYPPGGDNLPFVYSGTLAVRGHGIAEVLATGPRTQVGIIGRQLTSVTAEKTPLQQQTARLVRALAVIGLAVCVAVIILLTVTRGSFLDAILAGITLAMSLLPEEFPVVLTVFLALGAWRISKHRVLTRRTPAIETLGAATVLAVDKTGTLTENRMRVQVIEIGGVRLDVGSITAGHNPRVGELLGAAFAACEKDVVDPMDRAIVQAARSLAAEETVSFESMRLIREYDLTAGLLAVVHIWQSAGTGRLYVAAKGAPEAIASLCRLNASAREKLLAAVAQHGADGLRVLAVAHAEPESTVLPDDPRQFPFDLDGLIGLVDPVRETVPGAIAECYAAGIRVVMITGDYPATALAVARAIGLDVRAGILTGPELEALDDVSLAERVRVVNAYARMVPEQKLRLVQALKANGEIVAMTGDGVNDAPALKAAHIGVAMGSRGTDVAREAAALVLLEDDFAALVATVRAGRRIYENIRHAMSYLVAVHIPLGGMGLVPALVGWPLFLLPVHVVFLEFIIDPACTLVFEGERGAADLMRRPPRPAHEPLFTRRFMIPVAVLGAAMLAAVIVSYAIVLGGHGAEAARANAFATLVIANVLLIVTSRSDSESTLALLFRPNAAFLTIAALVFAALAFVLYFPPAAKLFQFAPPTSAQLALSAGLGAASVIWYDAVKLTLRRAQRHVS